MLEAIDLCQAIAKRELHWDLGAGSRIGDHRWWISDLEPFRRDYPDWEITRGVEATLREIFEGNVEMWTASALSSRSSFRRTTRPTRSG